MALMNLEQICDQWNATGTVMKMCSPLKMLYTCITIRRLQNFYHDYVFFLRNLLRFRKQIMTILCSNSHHFVLVTTFGCWHPIYIGCWNLISLDADSPLIMMLTFHLFRCWHPLYLDVDIQLFSKSTSVRSNISIRTLQYHNACISNMWMLPFKDTICQSKFVYFCICS